MFRRRKERKGLAEVLEALNDPQEAQALLQAMSDGLARTLRALLAIAAKTSQMYRDESAHIPEPPHGLQAGRARLMATVDELHIKRQRRYRTQTRWAMRFAGAVMAVVILLVPTGVYAFRASDQSLPGQVLYPLKHSQESYMLRRTREEPSASVALSMIFVDERIREMQALARRERPIPASVLASVDALTRRAVEAAAWTPEPMMAPHLQIIAWYNQTHIHALEALKAETASQNLDVLSDAQSVLVKRYLVTEAAMTNPDLFRAAYQAGEPEKLATPGGGPLGTPEPTRVLEDILEHPPTAAPTDLPAIKMTVPIPSPSVTPGVSGTPRPLTPEPADNPGVPADPANPADPGEPGEPAQPADPADPNNPETPPGQDVRPETPPGQEESPSDPPGQGNPPDDPPGQDTKPDNPPGQDKDKGKP